MKMLTGVVDFIFAYCSMLRVLLPAIYGHRVVARVRMILRSLRLGAFPAAAANACVTIAGAFVRGDRNEPTAIDDGDALAEFQRRGSLQSSQADRHRDRRRYRRRRRRCRMWGLAMGPADGPARSAGPSTASGMALASLRLNANRRRTALQLTARR
jgi:hypothetical protein